MARFRVTVFQGGAPARISATRRPLTARVLSMAVSIIPRLVRGCLYFQVFDVLFPSFAQAAAAWSAAMAHRLDIVECAP